MLKPFLPLALWAFLSTPTVAGEPITLVADEWPPFSGEDLPHLGLSVHVAQAVLERAGYEVAPQIVPWPRIMNGVPTGEYDAIGSLFYDEKLTPHIAYTDPFYGTDIQFARASSATHGVPDYDALSGYSIAVGDGFLYEDRFDADTDLNKITVQTTLQALRMVAFDRANLTLDSRDVLDFALNVEDPGLADRIDILPFVLARRDIHVGLSKKRPDHEEVLNRFNAALAQMHEDGSLDRLLAEHTEY